MIRILLFTTLFPNNKAPNHGVFVATRLRHVMSQRELKCTVLAPVPWFPTGYTFLARWSKFSSVKRLERFGDSSSVLHPRYFVIPKIGMSVAPFLLAIRSALAVQQLVKSGFKFDIIDAHYYYPDGVAAVILGKVFNKPVVITARGTDINLIPNYFVPRFLIKWAIKNAAHNITVCDELKKRLVDLGALPSDVTTLRNGVDLKMFIPVTERALLRQRLGFNGTVLLSVGHLIERKGHHIIIEAMTMLPEMYLYIVGSGEMEDALRALIINLELSDRVVLLGSKKQCQLCDLYSAADALILASSREGWANVLLESMACGTPVVATSVGGTPEVVNDRRAGVLAERSVQGIVSGVKNLFTDLPLREETRSYSESFSWDATCDGVYKVFTDVIHP